MIHVESVLGLMYPSVPGSVLSILEDQKIKNEKTPSIHTGSKEPYIYIRKVFNCDKGDFKLSISFLTFLSLTSDRFQNLCHVCRP